VFKGLRALGRAAALGAIVGACIAGTPAQAEPPGTPTGCEVIFAAGGGYSYCSAGPGFHRVKITCRRESNPNVVDIIYGYWRPSGYYSDAFCHRYGDVVLSRGYQVRTA
jgi:hypothetical protein